MKNIFQNISWPWRKKPSNWLIRTFEALAQRYGLAFGIAIAILIALLLTVVSMTLYFIGGTSKLDLSRPGYESVRKQIRHNDKDESFSANGTLDGKVIKDFLRLYDQETKDLQHYNAFDGNTLDDAQLGLTIEQTAPSDGARP